MKPSARAAAALAPKRLTERAYSVSALQRLAACPYQFALASLLKLGTWGPLMGVFGILSVMTLCSAAIIVYFLRHRREDFHPLKTLIAPLVGGLGCAYAAYLLYDNRAFLAGGTPLFTEALGVAVLIFFLVGVALALFYRSRDPERYAAIGRFVHEDA